MDVFYVKLMPMRVIMLMYNGGVDGAAVIGVLRAQVSKSYEG